MASSHLGFTSDTPVSLKRQRRADDESNNSRGKHRTPPFSPSPLGRPAVEQALVQAAVTGPARQNADVQAMQRVTDKRPVPTDATIAAFLIEVSAAWGID